MARADAHAPESWRAEALSIVTRLAATRSEFTADDVWACGLSSPPEARALGAVFRRARRLGLIENTDRFVRSSQPQCHKMPRLVWASKILGE